MTRLHRSWTFPYLDYFRGSRALLVAAHSIESGKAYEFGVGPDRFAAICTRYPMYPQVDVDVALCIVDREVRGIAFENVAIDRTWASVGSNVLLTGYGNAQPQAPNDGVFRIGNAAIVGERGFEFVARGGAAAGFGDSGGGGYIVRDGGRAINGVISKGNISNTTYLTRLSADLTLRFLESWSAKYSMPICGLDAAAKNRHPSVGATPTTFRLENSVALVQVQLKPAFVASPDAIRTGVEKALLSFAALSEE